MNLRKVFDELIKREDFYIPHITLGYYLTKDYNYSERNEIFNFLENEKIEFLIEFTFENLKYTLFTDMDNYIPIFPV